MRKPVHFHAAPGTIVATPDKQGRALVVEFDEAGCADVEDVYLASVLDGLVGIVREPHKKEGPRK